MLICRIDGCDTQTIGASSLCSNHVRIGRLFLPTASTFNPEQRASYVYAIRALDRVKIGTSVNAHARLAELQVGSAIPLELMGWIPGGRALESALHKHLASERVRGEWFCFGPLVCEIVEMMRTADPAGIDAILNRGHL